MKKRVGACGARHGQSCARSGSFRPKNYLSKVHTQIPEFKNASYAQRYEFFCRKLVSERHYTTSAFLLADLETGSGGAFIEPAPDLTLTAFVTSLLNHARNYLR